MYACHLNRRRQNRMLLWHSAGIVVHPLLQGARSMPAGHNASFKTSQLT